MGKTSIIFKFFPSTKLEDEIKMEIFEKCRALIEYIIRKFGKKPSVTETSKVTVRQVLWPAGPTILKSWKLC